jgi:hypothetical protein
VQIDTRHRRRANRPVELAVSRHETPTPRMFDSVPRAIVHRFRRGSSRSPVDPLPASSELAHDLRASNLSTEHLQSATSLRRWPVTTCNPDGTSAGGATMNHCVDQRQVQRKIQRQASFHTSRVKRGEQAVGLRRCATRFSMGYRSVRKDPLDHLSIFSTGIQKTRQSATVSLT